MPPSGPSGAAQSFSHDDNLVARVCHLFCEGRLTVSEIARKLGISREKPHELLRYAASQGWLQFVPPLEHELSFDLQNRFKFLERARVVRGVTSNDVSYHAALLLLDLIQ